MSCKFVLFACVAFLGFIQAHKKNFNTSVEQQKEDENIRNILYGETPNIHNCLNVSKNQKIDTNFNNKNIWTVVILKEEFLGTNTTIKKLSIQQCTGSLIHPQVVLTATHCIFNKDKTKLIVRAGQCNRKHDKKSTCMQSKIKSIMYQNKKNYNPSVPIKDIALIILKKKFDTSKNIGTICLLPTPVPANVRCFISGWKINRGKTFGASFRQTNLTTLSNDRCEKVLRMTGLGEEFNLHKSFMCAGEEFYKKTLNAYGGAPLVCPICGPNGGKWAQVGVMSWGFKTPPLPEVLTSVSSAHYWITEELKRKKLTLPNCGFETNNLQF